MDKAANDLLQPPLPAPAPPSRPNPPALLAPPKPPPAPKSFLDGMSWLNPAGHLASQGAQGVAGAVTRGVNTLAGHASPYQAMSRATETTPPLTGMTSGLPDTLRQPVNSALGFLQEGVKYMQPQGFAGVLGGLAPGLTKGLLSTPVGLPALAALHGLLRGGESFAAANTLFRPLLKRVGM